MEQKRTLWIILASGIFLLVVIGAAVILYAPAMNRNTNARALRDSGEIWVSPGLSSSSSTYVPPAATSDLTAPAKDSEASVTQGLASPAEGDFSELDIFAQNNPAENVFDPSQTAQSQTAQTQGAAVTQTDNLTVIANGTTNLIAGNTTIDLNALKNLVPSVSENVTAANQAAEKAMEETEKAYRVEEKSMIEKTVQTSQIVNVNVMPSQRVVEEKTETKAPAKSGSVKKSSTASASSETKAPAKSVKNSSTKTSTAKTSTAKPAATKTASVSAPATPDRFWVQAASFSTKKKADEARATLDANKIQCEVFTYKDDKGNLFYRVRVGPYTTKSEAEYWKKRIDAIPEFATSGSYVTNTTAKAK